MATDLASRSRTISIGTISDARIRADSSSRSNLPLHQHHLAVLRQVAVLLERLREDHDLDAARGIVEHEDAHAIALARLERTQARDDAADRDVLGDAAAPAQPARLRRAVRLRIGRCTDRLVSASSPSSAAIVADRALHA